MKTLSISILILTTLFTASAQKWALPSSKWITSYAWTSPTYYFTVKVEADTIIDGINCKKIGQYSPIFTYESNDTVYFHLGGKFRPTYYFNAQIGDTVSFYNTNYSDGYCGIDSIVYAVINQIDSVNAGNKFLRKFCGTIVGDTTTPSCIGFSYTEFIGSNYIYPYIYCPDIVDQESYGICDYGDSTIQDFFVYNNNCVTVSVNELQISDKLFSVYPNPVFTVLHFDISDDLGLTSVSVFNTSGKQLTTTKPNKKSIDFSDFTNGVYFIQAEFTNGQRAYKRVVKH